MNWPLDQGCLKTGLDADLGFRKIQKLGKPTFWFCLRATKSSCLEDRGTVGSFNFPDVLLSGLLGCWEADATAQSISVLGSLS